MAIRITRRKSKKTKVRLQPNEARNVIEKEFADSRGNKVKLRVNLNPHSPKEPTVDWQRKYGE